MPLCSTPAIHDLSLCPGNTIMVDITVNKFTAGPCKQQLLTKTNTTVLAAVSGEDYYQQTSRSSCPQLTAVHADGALQS